jgi:hypothetical protein
VYGGTWPQSQIEGSVKGAKTHVAVNELGEITREERLRIPTLGWKQTIITTARVVVAPWLPIYVAGRRVLVFVFEITFMAAFISAIIATIWLVLAVVAHLLELQFPFDFGTTTTGKKDPPGVCTMPLPFQKTT